MPRSRPDGSWRRPRREPSWERRYCCLWTTATTNNRRRRIATTHPSQNGPGSQGGWEPPWGGAMSSSVPGSCTQWVDSSNGRRPVWFRLWPSVVRLFHWSLSRWAGGSTGRESALPCTGVRRTWRKRRRPPSGGWSWAPRKLPLWWESWRGTSWATIFVWWMSMCVCVWMVSQQ